MSGFQRVINKQVLSLQWMGPPTMDYTSSLRLASQSYLLSSQTVVDNVTLDYSPGIWEPEGGVSEFPVNLSSLVRFCLKINIINTFN